MFWPERNNGDIRHRMQGNMSESAPLSLWAPALERDIRMATSTGRWNAAEASLCALPLTTTRPRRLGASGPERDEALKWGWLGVISCRVDFFGPLRAVGGQAIKRPNLFYRPAVVPRYVSLGLQRCVFKRVTRAQFRGICPAAAGAGAYRIVRARSAHSQNEKFRAIYPNTEVPVNMLVHAALQID